MPSRSTNAQAMTSRRPSRSSIIDCSHEITPRWYWSITSTYSGQVAPRSWETNASDLSPLGAEPSNPRQVARGRSQRPSRSSMMRWHTSQEGPTSGGVKVRGVSQAVSAVVAAHDEQVHGPAAEVFPIDNVLIGIVAIGAPANPDNLAAAHTADADSVRGGTRFGIFLDHRNGLRPGAAAVTRAGHVGAVVDRLDVGGQIVGGHELSVVEYNDGGMPGMNGAHVRRRVAVDKSGLTRVDHGFTFLCSAGC